MKNKIKSFAEAQKEKASKEFTDQNQYSTSNPNWVKAGAPLTWPSIPDNTGQCSNN